MTDTFKVVFFQRKPYSFHKSVEYIFSDVRRRMPPGITCITKVVSHYSKGVLPRMQIAWEAYKNQGDVNHITGDIHFASLLLKKSRTMLTVLDCGVLSDSKGLRHVMLKYFWFTLPLKSCALVTVISEATAAELRRYTSYPSNRIFVIPVAISAAYKYVPREFNKTKPEILLVGTMPNKNIHRLLDAVKGISCRLNIIGRLGDDILQKLKENGIEYRNGFDLSEEQLVAQYQQCDMLSFVSTYEGFGMPIVEANATGRPVITSNILSMPEVAGNAALMIDPFDVRDIRNGVLKIIEDDTYRNQLVQNGLENCKRFDSELIAGMYLGLYKDIYAGKYS